MEPMHHIVWNVSPILFALGPLEVRWYGLLFAASFVAGFFIFKWIYRREGKPEEQLDSLLFYMMLGTIVGARLGHVIFYDPGYYFSHPLDILKIWEGGLASHGGAVGIFLAIYLYVRKHPDYSYVWLLDRLAIPTALGGCFIRLGNLFNSEILGIPANVPWAFVFTRADALPRHPVQLYESFAYALIFVTLLMVYRFRFPRLRPGLLVGLFLFSVFSARFFLEFVKVRQASYEGEMTLSVGQWLSLPMLVLGLVFLLRRPCPRRVQ
jgi:phosphatidylglycerol:prolipoprotein diacylglycerol transferase